MFNSHKEHMKAVRELDESIDVSHIRTRTRIVCTLWSELPEEYGLRDASRIAEEYPEVYQGDLSESTRRELADRGCDVAAFESRIQPAFT